MNELDDDDDCKIEVPVYDAARTVAYVLMMNWFPAPQIMHYGSDSVVFNWTNKTDFPTTEHIHGYGCRLAPKMNHQLLGRGQFTEKKQRLIN